VPSCNGHKGIVIPAKAGIQDGRDVIPAKAGIQNVVDPLGMAFLDTGFRRCDGSFFTRLLNGEARQGTGMIEVFSGFQLSPE
jgi:hypothetical protein